MRLIFLRFKKRKKSEFKERLLTALSRTITKWVHLPAFGTAGGILVGINENKFTVLNEYLREFSVSIHLKNKLDNFEWFFFNVYGPTVANKRKKFLLELRDLQSLGINSFLICGDFNMVRRSKRVGKSYIHVVSNRFKNLIYDLQLMEISLSDRQYTWARSHNSRS